MYLSKKFGLNVHRHQIGSDLFHVTTQQGQRQMIIVETNSCPSGQKSMPLMTEMSDEHGGYGVVIAKAFASAIHQVDKDLGKLAVIFDKNPMEASGYAAVMADVFKEDIYLVEYYENDPEPPLKWDDGLMYIKKLAAADESTEWIPIRACFRYVTQKPWSRIPLVTKTFVFNPVRA
jgi:hypothetical protein